MSKAYHLDQGVYVWDRHCQVIRVGTVVFTNPPIHEAYITFRNEGRTCIANKRDVYTSRRKAIRRARMDDAEWVERYIY